jgi:hypothetical protein
MTDEQKTDNYSKAMDDSNNLQFPWKLHLLLSETARNEHHAIVSWLPDGTTFKVHNKGKFATEVMPQYFSSNKYKSFQRNLNLWCFQTETKVPNRGSIFHPCFVRGRPERCHLMKRVKIKKQSTLIHQAEQLHPVNGNGFDASASQLPCPIAQPSSGEMALTALTTRDAYDQGSYLRQLLRPLSLLPSAAAPAIYAPISSTWHFGGRSLSSQASPDEITRTQLLQSLAVASGGDALGQQARDLRARLLMNALLAAEGATYERVTNLQGI